MTTETSTPYEAKREEYIRRLEPLFILSAPPSDDIIKYFASLLRIVGTEDRGWDPYAESKATLNDINGFFSVGLPASSFPDPESTHWRLGLILYSHVVEMDAPYEVLTNLLRFRLGKGYSPNPFFIFLEEKEKQKFKSRGISTSRKIEIIQQLSKEAGLDVGDIFDDFYSNRLRNAIAHSDFILGGDSFRVRGGISGTRAFRVSYEELDKRIMCAKAFISALFQVEMTARQIIGAQKQKAIPYDQHFKGLLEILVDNNEVMCGFKVHWPNNTESTYSRTAGGIEMTNCSLDLQGATISLFVNLYAQNPGEFSPLVEAGSVPVYTALAGCSTTPVWPE